jgi:tetratricopeptide (TPR) repeat protein
MLTFSLIILIIISIGCTIYFSYFKPKQNPLNKAIELTKQNKFLEAIDEYKKSIVNKSDAFDVNFKIAGLYERLKNYDQELYYLNEILRIDKYNTEVQKLAVLKMLAQSYYFIKDIEKAFQTYFEILKINPDDAEAHYHISFIALGQGEFDIAQRYFEKLVQVQDDFESFFGAGICSYQNNKNADAVKYFKEALSIKPTSDIAALAISFALQRIEKYSEAILYVNKLIGRITEDEVKYISKRLLAFLTLESDKNEEGMHLLEELLNFAKEKNMQDELKLSLYDVGFACVKNKLLNQAFNYWEELYRIDNSYEDTRELMNLLKKDINSSSNSDGFENSIFDYVDDWERSAFSSSFLWNICGLKSNQIIDIKNIVVPAKMSKGKDISRLTSTGESSESTERIAAFRNLDNESFRMASTRLVLKLGNKVNEILHTYRDSDGVDILSQSEENGDKVLVWVRRWKDSKVGEITLRNFAQAVNDIKARKGIFITSAELTKAAQTSLTKLNKIIVIYPAELNDLLKGLL